MCWAFWGSFHMGAECFLLSKMCLPSVGLTQPAVEWVAGALSLEVKWSIKLNACLHLVLSISIEWRYSFAPSILFPLPRYSYLWAVWSRDQIPMGPRFSAPIQTCHGGLPNLLYSGYQVSFLGVKRPGHDIDHPLPTSAEAKEECRYTGISPLSLYVLFYGELNFLCVPFLPPLHLCAMVCKYSYNCMSTLCSSMVPLFLTQQLSNLNASHNPQIMETSKNKTQY